MNVAVLGAAGKVGQEVTSAILAAPSLALAALVDPSFADPAAGSTATPATPAATATPATSAAAAVGPVVAERVDQLDASQCDVAVDFTVAAAARANAEWCAANGVHFVCGTTGLGPEDLRRFGELFGIEPGDARAQQPARRANAVVAANFALSAVLMMRFAELAAPYFDGVEIIELHHGAKLDAPSGTALETARRIAASRRRSGAGPFQPDPTASGLDGARGADLGASDCGPLPVHSVRLNGLVAHQEVLFGAVGQSLSIRQDSYDRSSYMPGVLLAVRAVGKRPGLTIGLEPLLEL